MFVSQFVSSRSGLRLLGIALVACILLCLACAAQASVITLGSFNAAVGEPTSPILLGSDGFLYGTAWYPTNFGYVYRVLPTGGGFQIIHQFSGPDGSAPMGALMEGLDGDVYGVCRAGGNEYSTKSPTAGFGVVYKFKKNGTIFAVLHKFAGSDGVQPVFGLVQDPRGILYGITQAGGPKWTPNGPDFGYGVVYSMTTIGLEFSLVHAFVGVDGDSPSGLAIAVDGSLYGSTTYGGTGFTTADLLTGLLFNVQEDGSDYRIVREFNTANGGLYPSLMALSIDGSLFGGMTKPPVKGALPTYGSIFSVPEDGTSLTILHTFRGPDGDGLQGLTVGPGGLLFGATRQGGPNAVSPIDGSPYQGGGTLFYIDMNGDNFNLITALDPLFEPDGAPGLGALGGEPVGNPCVTSHPFLFVTTSIAGVRGYGALDRAYADVPVPYIVSTSPTTLVGAKAQYMWIVGGGFDMKAGVQINGVEVAVKRLSPIEIKLTLNVADVPDGGVYNVTVTNPGQPQPSNPWTVTVPSDLVLGTAVLTAKGPFSVSAEIPIETTDHYPASDVTVKQITLALPFIASAQSFSPSSFPLIKPGSPGVVTALFDIAGHKTSSWILKVTIDHSGREDTLTQTVTEPS